MMSESRVRLMMINTASCSAEVLQEERRRSRRRRSYGVMMMMSVLMTQLMLPPWLQPLVQLVRLMVLRLLSSVPSLTWRTGRSSTN